MEIIKVCLPNKGLKSEGTGYKVKIHPGQDENPSKGVTPTHPQSEIANLKEALHIIHV